MRPADATINARFYRSFDRFPLNDLLTDDGERHAASKDFNLTSVEARALGSGRARLAISISAIRTSFAILPSGPTPLAAASRPSLVR
jgi:hypothetical protein